MKATKHFQNTIKAYLDKRAEIDLLFSLRYSLPKKKLEDCVTYILNQVQKSGCNGFHDDEIFGMAVHFYDEDNIEIGKPIHNAQVAVNHLVVLSAEEKEQAHQDAIQRAQDEAYRKMTQPTKKAKRVALNPQPSLFDF